MNNYYKQCPALMSDGRILSDYESDTKRNEYIKYLNSIYRDDDYRLFLQYNADKIMNKEWEYLKNDYSCHVGSCTHNYPTRTNLANFKDEMVNTDNAFKFLKSKRTNVCDPSLKDYTLTKM